MNRISSGTLSSPGTAAAPAVLVLELPPSCRTSRRPRGRSPRSRSSLGVGLRRGVLAPGRGLIRASRAIVRALGRLTGARLCLGSAGGPGCADEEPPGAPEPPVLEALPGAAGTRVPTAILPEVDVGPAGAPLVGRARSPCRRRSAPPCRGDHGRVVGREGLFGRAELLSRTALSRRARWASSALAALAASSRLRFMTRKAKAPTRGAVDELLVAVGEAHAPPPSFRGTKPPPTVGAARSRLCAK